MVSRLGKGFTSKWAACLLLLLSCSALHAQVTYVYTDPQGTPLAEADAHGNITATYDYAPYGNQALGTPPNGPGYTGHVNDPDTGLVYMQARYYDPSTGRLLSVDPVQPAAGNSFNFNRYDYANNNRINHTDPDGRCADGVTCDQMVQSYGKWAAANPAQADKIGSAVGVPGVTAMLVASGAGDAVAVVKGAAILDKVLSDSSSESKSVGGINLGNTPSTARQALTDAGHPGDPITNPQGTEQGTIHTISDKKMDVRVMDGNANNSPRAVTNRTDNPKQLVDPNTGKNFGNDMSKAQQRDQAHVPLDGQ